MGNESGRGPPLEKMSQSRSQHHPTEREESNRIPRKEKKVEGGYDEEQSRDIVSTGDGSSLPGDGIHPPPSYSSLLQPEIYGGSNRSGIISPFFPPRRTTGIKTTTGGDSPRIFNTRERRGMLRGKVLIGTLAPIIFALFTMASFMWLTYILLFLVPALSTFGGAHVVPSSPPGDARIQNGTSSLGSFALQKVLSDSAGVFGILESLGNSTTYPTGGNSTRSQNRSSWMKLIPDGTPISDINIPGTHDSATWNFTQANADSIRHNVDPANQVFPAAVYQCQRVSLWESLERGVRFFDLRYGLDPEGVRLVFYHAHALMSELATVEDVLFGFYNWLDSHPSEVVILSVKMEVSYSFAPYSSQPNQNRNFYIYKPSNHIWHTSLAINKPACMLQRNGN